MINDNDNNNNNSNSDSNSNSNSNSSSNDNIDNKPFNPQTLKPLVILYSIRMIMIIIMIVSINK